MMAKKTKRKAKPLKTRRKKGGVPPVTDDSGELPQPKRLVKMRTISDLITERARIYSLVEAGQMDISEATKRSYVLGQQREDISQAYWDREIVKRRGEV